MTEHEASRTLLKSPPELWAECSDAGSLARHIGEFGAIRITRLEPESAVAWEGTLASGTVRLEPSGWGTRVILTARARPAQAVDDAPTGAAEDAVAEPPAAHDAALEPEASAGRLGNGRSASPDDEQASRRAGPDAAAPPGIATPPRAVVPPAVTPPAPPATPPRAQPAHRSGLLSRIMGRFRRSPVQAPAPGLAPPPPPPSPIAAPEEPMPAPGPACLEPDVLLEAALDSLGRAHRRPFAPADQGSPTTPAAAC